MDAVPAVHTVASCLHWISPLHDWRFGHKGLGWQRAIALGDGFEMTVKQGGIAVHSFPHGDPQLWPF